MTNLPDPLQLRLYPDPVLKRRAEPITLIDETLRTAVRTMFDIMYEEAGIGLAAPQVGWSARLFVINLESDPEQPDEEHVFINPVITEPAGEETEEEGCLSLPDIRVPIRRPETIHVSAIGLNGEPFELTTNDLFARCIQHENDHLDGILLPDRTTFGAKLTIKKQLKEMVAEYQRSQD